MMIMDKFDILAAGDDDYITHDDIERHNDIHYSMIRKQNSMVRNELDVKSPDV